MPTATLTDRPRAPTAERLTFEGGDARPLPGGKVGGYLVRFDGPGDASAFRDVFTAKTNYWIEFPARIPVLYHHGLCPHLDLRRIGTAELAIDAQGIKVVTTLKARDKHEAKIIALVEKGALGWSSGAPAHMVRRTRLPGNRHRVDSWAICEATLTPAPAETRTTAASIKTLLTAPGDDLADPDAWEAAQLKLRSRWLTAVGGHSMKALIERAEAALKRSDEIAREFRKARYLAEHYRRMDYGRRLALAQQTGNYSLL